MEETAAMQQLCDPALEPQRRQAVAHLAQNPGPEALWDCLRLFAGVPFHTSKGLPFTYRIQGSEMFVSRKDKSITRATVLYAYQRVLAGQTVFDGPKKLGCFGASYLYPIFRRLGIISDPS